jgi:hypothetical protein
VLASGERETFCDDHHQLPDMDDRRLRDQLAAEARNFGALAATTYARGRVLDQDRAARQETRRRVQEHLDAGNASAKLAEALTASLTGATEQAREQAKLRDRFAGRRAVVARVAVSYRAGRHHRPLPRARMSTVGRAPRRASVRRAATPTRGSPSREPDPPLTARTSGRCGMVRGRR